MRVAFIEGPWDGQVHDIPDGIKVCEVGVTPTAKSPFARFGETPSADLMAETALYRITLIASTDGLEAPIGLLRPWDDLAPNDRLRAINHATWRFHIPPHFWDDEESESTIPAF